MFEWIYENFAYPIIQKPYQNSGIFVTPIDFYRMPESIMATKRRIAIPNDRIDPEWTAVTYELNGSRESLPFTPATMRSVADIWHRDVVTEWFGKDETKVFYYVPQIATYIANGITISLEDVQHPNLTS